MYAIIAIFYASLLGMIVMVMMKRHEALTGRPSVVSRLGSGSDHSFHRIFSSIGKGLSYFNRKTATALAQWLAIHALKRIRSVYISIKDRFISHPQGKKILDAVRGRGEVKDHGASFYLRHIAAEQARK